MNYFRTSRTIDQTISVVRKHLGEKERIVAVFGVGYRHEFLFQQTTASTPEVRPNRVQGPTGCRMPSAVLLDFIGGSTAFGQRTNLALQSTTVAFRRGLD